MNGWTFLAVDGYLHAWAPPRPDVRHAAKTVRVHARVRITASAREHKAELVRVITEHEARPHPHAHPDDLAYAIGAPPPDPPAGFAVTAEVQTRDDVGECSVTAIGYAAIVWTATALGATFVRYEIQRSVDGGPWLSIATVISEEMETFADYEAPRGVECAYRMRVVDSAGGASSWTDTATVTVSSVYCEWLFVSNVDPSLNAGVQVRPEREYTYPNTPDIVVKKLEGRDFHATFRPLENRGVIIALSVTASILRGTSEGTRAFDPLRAIFEDTLIPYVCVLDPYGNSFLATVVMAPAREIQPDDRYYVDLTVVETTQTPYVVLATLARIYDDTLVYNDADTYNI